MTDNPTLTDAARRILDALNGPRDAELVEALLTGNAATQRAARNMITRYNAAAEAAIAALAPKLTWTEWKPEMFDGYSRSELRIGTIPVGCVSRYPSHVTGWVSDLLFEKTTKNTPEAIAALRTEIERRVREAMENTHA